MYRHSSSIFPSFNIKFSKSSLLIICPMLSNNMSLILGNIFFSNYDFLLNKKSGKVKGRRRVFHWPVFVRRRIGNGRFSAEKRIQFHATLKSVTSAMSVFLLLENNLLSAIVLTNFDLFKCWPLFLTTKIPRSEMWKCDTYVLKLNCFNYISWFLSCFSVLDIFFDFFIFFKLFFLFLNILQHFVLQFFGFFFFYTYLLFLTSFLLHTHFLFLSAFYSSF